MAFDVNKHHLVPKQSILNETEKKKLLEDYKIDIRALPKIFKEDQAIVKLKVKLGDVVKTERVSKTAGTTTYYRVVIDG